MSSTPAQPDPTDPAQTDPAQTEHELVETGLTEREQVEPERVETGQTEPEQVRPATEPAEPAPTTGTADQVVAIPADGPLTDEQVAAIAATARPATIRRAPRYRGFFWTGALVGIVLGVVFGLGLSYDGMVNRWIYVTVTVLGTTLVTVLVAGALAALVDKRGATRAARQREATDGR